MSFNPDDPKYTAYVLGELDENERTAIDADVDADPAAAATVAEIRATTLRLSTALQVEPLPAGPAGAVPKGSAVESGVAVLLVTKQYAARRRPSWKAATGALAAIAGCGLIAALWLSAINKSRESD